jgi:hypothetical protein
VSTFVNSASKSAIVAIYAARPDFVPLGALKGEKPTSASGFVRLSSDYRTKRLDLGGLSFLCLPDCLIDINQLNSFIFGYLPPHLQHPQVCAATIYAGRWV